MIESEVYLALESLGSTSKAVAATLKAAGALGQRRECRHCPLAVYLASNFKASAVVDPSIATVTKDCNCVRVLMPLPCRQFLLNFDHGDHPELEVTR